MSSHSYPYYPDCYDSYESPPPYNHSNYHRSPYFAEPLHHQSRYVDAYESPHSDPYKSRHRSSRIYDSYDYPPSHDSYSYPSSDSHSYYESSYVPPVSHTPSRHTNVPPKFEHYSTPHYHHASSPSSYHHDLIRHDSPTYYPHHDAYTFSSPTMTDSSRDRSQPISALKNSMKKQDESLKRLEESFERQRALAAELPKLWCEHVAMEKLEQRKCATVLIQSHFRGFLQRRSFERMIGAILFIQTQMRGYWQRRLFLKVQSSVIIIQRHVRQWILRRRSIICQSKWIYYNPLFSTDGEDWEEESVVEEPLSTIQMRVATPMDLLQRFGRPLLSYPVGEFRQILGDVSEITHIDVTGVPMIIVDFEDYKPHTIEPTVRVEFEHDRVISFSPRTAIHYIWDPGDIQLTVLFGQQLGHSDFPVLSLDLRVWDPGDCLVCPYPIIHAQSLEFMLSSIDSESAAPSLSIFDRVLTQRPLPKPPDNIDSDDSAWRPASGVGMIQMIWVSTVRIRPPLKPPWRF